MLTGSITLVCITWIFFCLYQLWRPRNNIAAQFKDKNVPVNNPAVEPSWRAGIGRLVPRSARWRLGSLMSTLQNRPFMKDGYCFLLQPVLDNCEFQFVSMVPTRNLLHSTSALDSIPVNCSEQTRSRQATSYASWSYVATDIDVYWLYQRERESSLYCYWSVVNVAIARVPVLIVMDMKATQKSKAKPVRFR